MVHLTPEEKKSVSYVLDSINIDKVGGEALARLMQVSPFTRKYFTSFGDLSTPAAIDHNTKVHAHGAKVLHSIVDASKHLDNLPAYYADLSTVHCLKLFVDPANFSNFGGIFIVVLGQTLGTDFTPKRQVACEKLMAAVADALSRGYH